MDLPTHICVSNQETIKMANAQQSNCRTWHVEMKHFVVLQWIDDKYINFIGPQTDENYSDSLCKLTSQTKLYAHIAIFIGWWQQEYTTGTTV